MQRRPLALALALAGGGAQAKTLGLVFGVSAYPNLPADKQLRAPANDVRRILRAFSARGLPAGDFAVLWPAADGVARIGARAGRFHATTGYSLAHAVRTAAALPALVDRTDFTDALRAEAAVSWRRQRFYRITRTDRRRKQQLIIVTARQLQSTQLFRRH